MAKKSGEKQRPIFVSHAAADKELVAKFVDGLLLPGLDLTTSRIFCTSLEGMKIPAGKDFIVFVKEQIQDPQVVLMLLTPNYLDRVFCCCEMGASWALSHEGIPILVPPLDYDDLEAVLKTTQAVKIDQKQGLNEVKDRIVGALSIAIPSTERWEQKRDQFLAELPNVIKKLPPPEKVDRLQYEKLDRKYILQIQDLQECHDKIAELEAVVEELRKAKDKEEVDDIMRRHSTCWEEFEALTESIHNCAKELPEIVIEVIYCDKADVPFRVPDMYDSRLQHYIEAIADGLITDLEKTGKAEPVSEDMEVGDFLDAISEVEDLLWRAHPDNEEGDCHDFYDEYRDKYRHPPRIENRKFWSECLRILEQGKSCSLLAAA